MSRVGHLRSRIPRGVLALALISTTLWATTPFHAFASAAGLTYNPVAPGALASMTLPLRICPTSYGVDGVKPAKLPARIRALAPRGDATTLSVFSDGLGLVRLIAPVTWDCRATVGADGSSSVTIVAPDTVARVGALARASRIQEITGYQSGGCVGCAIAQACSLFANARARAQGFECRVKVHGERVRRISGSVVDFVDPPGVHGNANPSGGAYPSYGVMTFRAGRAAWTRLATCVMGPVDVKVCAAVMGNFIGPASAG